MRDKMESVVQEALVQNYDKYYRLAYGYVHNESDAMDIVQEGAYKAILGSASLKNAGYADTWIYRIMINEAFSLVKKRGREADRYDELRNSAAEADPYEDFDLKKAIEGLDDTDRMIVTLRFFEDMKLDQIAGILATNVNTVKSRLYRSLKKLRLTLEAEGGNENGE